MHIRCSIRCCLVCCSARCHQAPTSYVHSCHGVGPGSYISIAVPPSSGYTAIGLSIASVLTVVAKYYLVPKKYHGYIPNWNAIGTFCDARSSPNPLTSNQQVLPLSCPTPTTPSPCSSDPPSTTSGSSAAQELSTCTCSPSLLVSLPVRVLVVSCKLSWLSPVSMEDTMEPQLDALLTNTVDRRAAFSYALNDPYLAAMVCIIVVVYENLKRLQSSQLLY